MPGRFFRGKGERISQLLLGIKLVMSWKFQSHLLIRSNACASGDLIDLASHCSHHSLSLSHRNWWTKYRHMILLEQSMITRGKKRRENRKTYGTIWAAMIWTIPRVGHDTSLSSSWYYSRTCREYDWISLFCCPSLHFDFTGFLGILNFVLSILLFSNMIRLDQGFCIRLENIDRQA